MLWIQGGIVGWVGDVSVLFVTINTGCTIRGFDEIATREIF